MLRDLFPTLIWTKSLPKDAISGSRGSKGRGARGLPVGLVDRLLYDCEQFEKIDQAGRSWSKAHYPHGYTSYGSTLDCVHVSSNFGLLKDWIDREVVAYATALQWDCRPDSLVLSNLWINRMGPGARHSYHLHPHSVVSGTFYVQVPFNSSGIRFEDPRLSQMMAAPARKKSAPKRMQPYILHQPKAGELVLFESYLKHEVPPLPRTAKSNVRHLGSKSTAYRWSISFNYAWRG